MKKFLSLFATTSLVVGSATFAISCGCASQRTLLSEFVEDENLGQINFLENTYIIKKFIEKNDKKIIFKSYRFRS